MMNTDDYCGGDCSCAYPEDCVYNKPELEDRNEGPTNRFGCSYVDCGCIEPCTAETVTTDIPNAATTIVINGGNVTFNIA